jgi:ribosomal-protein-alanine N-acetyltransferase
LRALVTPRFTLEPQTAAHAAQMFTVLSDPRIYEFENQPPPSLEWLRARYTKLESRRSADGREQWLNWVVRMPTTELAGYVQATIPGDGSASIAYEFASAYWGRGLASEAVAAMIDELAGSYGVRRVQAVLKRANLRSARLLQRLGFAIAPEQDHARQHIATDEMLMVRE